MPRRKARVIVRKVLRIQQDLKHPLYMFALTGDELLEVAEISRLSRSGNGKLLGYQRPEIRRHIQNITDYLNGDNVLFPNSIIVALNSSISFQKNRGAKGSDSLCEAGTLKIPVPREGEEKPGWIVDGQQRAIALARSRRSDLPVPVTGFIADDTAIQRDQFLRINSARPLPQSLITELLPEISSLLPAGLAAKKLPSSICDYLNLDSESPFHGLIRRPSLSRDQLRLAVIRDTSIIMMLEDSLENPAGCLFAYRDLGAGKTDFEGIRKVLYLYWGAVKESYPEAWGKSPAKTRLMHGTGIRAMGKLMDRIMSNIDPDDPDDQKSVSRAIQALRPVCRWTKGRWEGMNGLPWNGVQNVSSHIRGLSNLLIRAHLDAKVHRT